jgi:hypothetical protein
MAFPKKTPTEIKLATFDFEPEVPAGAVLSNPDVSVTSATGDGSDVTDVDVGVPAVVGLTVTVLLGGGLDACKYRIKCAVDVDDGEHAEIDKDLPVSEKAALV